MNFTYPKPRNKQPLVYYLGKSVSKYPLRLVYKAGTLWKWKKKKWAFRIQKNFKSRPQLFQTRVARNLSSKQTFVDNLDQPYSFMFFYQTKDRLIYQEINTKTIQLFEKFIAQKNSKTSSRKQYCLKFNIYTSK
jgi:ribonuclease P protein component